MNPDAEAAVAVIAIPGKEATASSRRISTRYSPTYNVA
jgi:hypothetical protein